MPSSFGDKLPAPGRWTKAHFEKSVEAFRKWEFTTSPLDHIETLLYLAQLHVKDGELEQAHKELLGYSQ